MPNLHKCVLWKVRGDSKEVSFLTRNEPKSRHFTTMFAFILRIALDIWKVFIWKTGIWDNSSLSWIAKLAGLSNVNFWIEPGKARLSLSLPQSERTYKENVYIIFFLSLPFLSFLLLSLTAYTVSLRLFFAFSFPIRPFPPRHPIPLTELIKRALCNCWSGFLQGHPAPSCQSHKSSISWPWLQI